MPLGTDCVKKAIAANPIHNGTLVQSTTPAGVNRDIDTTYVDPNPTTVDATETVLTTRFDDPQHYYA